MKQGYVEIDSILVANNGNFEQATAYVDALITAIHYFLALPMNALYNEFKSYVHTIAFYY